MAFFDWLKGLFEGQADRDAYWLHVRCNECGELIRTRIDLSHDLTTQYDDNGRVAGYFTRKTLIGSGTCFNQIEAKIYFSPRRRPESQDIHGGQLISQEEYQQHTTKASASNSG